MVIFFASLQCVHCVFIELQYHVFTYPQYSLYSARDATTTANELWHFFKYEKALIVTYI